MYQESRIGLTRPITGRVLGGFVERLGQAPLRRGIPSTCAGFLDAEAKEQRTKESRDAKLVSLIDKKRKDEEQAEEKLVIHRKKISDEKVRRESEISDEKVRRELEIRSSQIPRILCQQEEKPKTAAEQYEETRLKRLAFYAKGSA